MTVSLLHRRLTALCLAIAASFAISSCATESTNEPTPVTTTESESVSLFFTPVTYGEADDVYIMFDDEDDTEFSYFLDEEEYLFVRDWDEKDAKKGHYKFIKSKVKRGHGYGDHNHMHMHRKMKVAPKYHGRYIGVRRIDWTDSLKITVEQRRAIDTAMKEFKACAQSALDSFKVLLKPAREEFRLAKMSILVQLDSNQITRDSARVLLDSAIMHYEDKTFILRESLKQEIKICLDELDAFMRARFDAGQYSIWIRHRGW